jgi:hypothetical protein
MGIVSVAAVIYAIIILGVIAFQIALVAGVPWGAYAMGGAFPGQLPPALRIAAIVQAVLLAGMAAVILAQAGLILPGWSQGSWLVWIVVAVMLLGLVLNLITPSAGERKIWAPTLAILLICSLIVALAR